MRKLDARLSTFLLTSLLAACGGSKATSPDAAGATGTAGDAGAAGKGGADAASEAVAPGDANAGDHADAAPDGAPLPPPTLFASAPGGGALHLALAGAKLYWTERATGAVRALALDAAGGTPTTVASGNLPGPIAVDDTNVYWANEGDKTITKVPLAGGAAALVLTAPDVVTGLLARGGALYYGAGASTYKVVLAGGASTTLMTFPPCRTSRPHALAIDADHLYQTDENLQFLTREKLDGTQLINDRCAADPTTAPQVAAPDTITHSQGDLLLDALTLVGGQLIWADGANVATKTVTGDDGTTLASSVDGNKITGFAVDQGSGGAGARLYFAEGSPTTADGTGDAIELAAIDLLDGGATGDPKVVARDQANAAELVVDATHLYWTTTTGTDGAILRLAK